VKTSGVEAAVDGMVMRHSYAVHSLEAGMTVRDLQHRLGHKQVKTTMIYLRVLHPRVTSPVDNLPVPEAVSPATPTPPIPAQPAPTVPAPLFPMPLTTDRLVLPFTAEPAGLTDTAKAFHACLQTRVVGGFLALKRAFRSTA